MYGCTALENPKMSMTSTSLAVSRVCVTVDSSWALTTARSIEMFGFASSNVVVELLEEFGHRRVLVDQHPQGDLLRGCG